MGQIAFVFAGQGAQQPGMGRSIYDASAAARAIFDRAEALRPGTRANCFEGPAEALSVTINTQPCLMAVDCACAAAAREAGIVPDALAGFSLGELAAVHDSGMLPFDEAFKLVMRRASLMQDAAEAFPGAMGAVLRLTWDQVAECCAEIEGAWPVNDNCPGQVVVACAEDRFLALENAVADRRGRVVRLNVSGAFHSPAMKPASARLRDYMKPLLFHPPVVPLYANATAAPYAGNYKALLSRQVCSPVRWRETILNMAAAGIDTFVEVGAGTTLSGLIAKTLPGARTCNISDAESLAAARAALV